MARGDRAAELVAAVQPEDVQGLEAEGVKPLDQPVGDVGDGGLPPDGSEPSFEPPPKTAAAPAGGDEGGKKPPGGHSGN